MNTIEGNEIRISEQDRILVSGFMGEEYPCDIDWNLLMPVVEKMSTIHYGWDNMETPYDDCCYPRTFGMLNAEGKPMVRFNSSQVFTADTLIEATWLSVVDFIQWYNNQTPTNKNNKV